jgi:hypothetical protein
MSRLVTVRSFNTPAEADCARLLLAGAGIEAYLADEALVGNFWTLGNAVGGVKLQVAEADWERASDLLEADAEERAAPPAGTAWQCSKCGAEVEAGFETCWQCGTSRDGVEDPDFVPHDAAGDDDDDEDDEEEAEAFDELAVQEELRRQRAGADGNPYASPHARFPADERRADENRDGDDDEDDDPDETEGDAIAQRALRAAIFGLAGVPFIMTAYSAMLLVDLKTSNAALSYRGTRARRHARWVNWLTVCLWGGLFTILILITRS